ncbi:MAG: prepilin-type N-terminal cleavage/methylation domain-containing protein, partial [Chloroflexi bacterium]|nr:prepilin-type N-terminal cleavage/methylation domain-containing protein [Chloroflexota bacterium]
AQPSGTTLTELLVVIVVLSLLASIAVPVAINRSTQGKISAARADVKALANAEEMVARTTTEAEANAERIWANANTEIQRIRADLEAAQAAAQRELENQRTLTDTLRERVAAQQLAPESILSVGEVPVADTASAEPGTSSAKRARSRKKASAPSAKSASKSKSITTPKRSTTEKKQSKSAKAARRREQNGRFVKKAVRMSEAKAA